MRKNICHDCGAKEGEIHQLGCDMERCPFCGGQLLSCDCKYKYLGYHIDRSKKYSGLSMNVYKHGVSDEEEDKWLTILEKKERVPHICYPIVCCYCGRLWPDLFMVPDAEWNRYIQLDKQDKVICRKCYDKIKDLIDTKNG